jgi:hypothetical protein
MRSCPRTWWQDRSMETLIMSKDGLPTQTSLSTKTANPRDGKQVLVRIGSAVHPLAAEASSMLTTIQEQQDRGQSAHVKPKNGLNPQERGEGLPPIRKRKRHSSSDSSIIAVPVRPKSQPLDKGKEETSTGERLEKATDDFRKKRRTEPSEQSSSDPFADENPPNETFERRARHKTREDKYEPKTSKKKTKEASTEKKPREKKKEKRSDRKRAAKQSGEEVMNRFSSKSIGQERLTVSTFRIIRPCTNNYRYDLRKA